MCVNGKVAFWGMGAMVVSSIATLMKSYTPVVTFGALN
jgi:hypothetical protein